jgi:serine protease Do
MKNSITVFLVALLVVVNGVLGVMHLQAGGRISDDQAKITAMEAASTSIESGIAAIATERAEAQAALAALQSSAAKFSLTSATALAKYGTIIDTIKPSVVKINATGSGLRGYCSGVIVSSSGYVLTVLHNVTGARSITVTLASGEQLPATITATDSTNNLALLKITSTRTDFPAAARGKMNDLQPAQTVISAGFPLSPELTGPATFTCGIVSALRTTTDYFFIQSDADIAPGSGGGGLFTLDGKLVGLASQTEGTGIYLYVPIDAAAKLLSDAKIS